ncbi:MAG: tRNA pseudouridine(38-40) synthase TruA [Neisseriales bacterium]|nr:MAG: tRNA pseudouridine(38-40) synthase TruA [Neisseriales bacterium]
MNNATRIALGLEYNGQLFAGWQRQTHQQTLQGSLEAALSIIAQEKITVHAAGRTDTGVHATRQVVHFDTFAHRPLNAWVRGVNRYLPPNIAIQWAQHMPSDFHARFSALSRQYSYWLLCRPTRPGFLHGQVGWCFQPLDIQSMQQAAQIFIGQHDFSSFRSSACQAKSPIRTLYQLTIVRHDHLFCCTFKADGFLHHMVRNIMGALIYVGKGVLTYQHLQSLLASKKRSGAPPTFMPDGLYLTDVYYPKVFKLPKTAAPSKVFALLKHAR